MKSQDLAAEAEKALNSATDHLNLLERDHSCEQKQCAATLACAAGIMGIGYLLLAGYQQSEEQKLKGRG